MVLRRKNVLPRVNSIVKDFILDCNNLSQLHFEVCKCSISGEVARSCNTILTSNT